MKGRWVTNTGVVGRYGVSRKQVTATTSPGKFLDTSKGADLGVYDKEAVNH